MGGVNVITEEDERGTPSGGFCRVVLKKLMKENRLKVGVANRRIVGPPNKGESNGQWEKTKLWGWFILGEKGADKLSKGIKIVTGWRKFCFGKIHDTGGGGVRNRKDSGRRGGYAVLKQRIMPGEGRRQTGGGAS